MKNQYHLKEIAEYLGLPCIGEHEEMISGIAPLQSAQKGQLSFLDNTKYKKYLSSTQASAVILTAKDADDCCVSKIISDNPYLAYAKALHLFQTEKEFNDHIHPTAMIDPTANIHPGTFIGPYVVVGARAIIHQGVSIAAHCVIEDDCVIGENTYLHSHVTLYRKSQLGARCLIHSGVVIGSDGFGFARSEKGWFKVPHLGHVLIGHDVEIGANTTIDRGALEMTYIGNGVKLDNQIQIGHNVHIGDHTIIAGCVGIAGSAHIGKNCMIGGGVGIAGHLSITDGVVITAMTGISKSINEPGIYSAGMQAEKRDTWRKNAVHFQHLSNYVKRIQKLEKKLLQD